VAVEKLLPAKLAKIKSRQDALQTTFSVFLYSIPQFLAVLKKMDFFNSHRRLQCAVKGTGPQRDERPARELCAMNVFDV
jgi:ABC-type dipeptide/oligopeptide/nickel transport system permease component